MKPNRSMPMWPTYSARTAAAAIFLTTIPDEFLPFIRDSEHPSLFSFGISGCATISDRQSGDATSRVAGERAPQWHQNKEPFQLASVILTAGLLAVGVATIAFQWQKS
ncbi:hypothetical protein GOL81_26370 [Sinorhizobium medicae]|uniref:hypothetical protein n=1 Tax=Sinorhizobium medicae TaxID=110321 RepID=UPI001AAD59AD|nr:hypothetical protein [Sinorhizobium medicae]MBO1944290.1 hypothetical protein [Sinorhizobium medicae]MDX0518807.1 hypothetical protein [Sinorhizobium medicae]MDX0729222.1 hypothetical protein [Sinorhizobium medicae]MDX0735443.1 hypothetical protein [Sinorhizobium medicae]MDX0815437.1 hypothetical protein [Sinorhizobium medicae]